MMGFKRLMVALVCLSLASSAAGILLEELVASETRPFDVISTARQPNTNYSGEIRERYSAPGEHDDHFETSEKLSAELSYETAWTLTGKRKLTLIKVNIKTKTHLKDSQLNESQLEEPFPADSDDDIPDMLQRRWKNRNRRELFGKHRRYYIPARSYAQRYPFEVVVKLSTGCTGTLVSPRHVLTAAHCLHTGKDYTKGFRTLKVGFLEANKTFTWINAVQAKLPLAWIAGKDLDASRYDYAIVKLELRHERQYMPVTYSENARYGKTTKIHFTAFEDDRPSNTMWYRACFILTATNDMMYHCCDAQPGSSGAGIYVYHLDKTTGRRDRRIIGVFSGNRNVRYHQWWPYVGCPPVWRGNFNAGIRLNSLKFQQICTWVGEKHAGEDCRIFLARQKLRAREPTVTERGRRERGNKKKKKKKKRSGRAAKKERKAKRERERKARKRQREKRKKNKKSKP